MLLLPSQYWNVIIYVAQTEEFDMARFTQTTPQLQREKSV
jgi:hypothetical protein